MITPTTIPTVRYATTQASCFPAILDPDGCYPYTQAVRTDATGQSIDLEVFCLENVHLQVLVCPALNGRILSIVHKGTGREVLYRNDVIKPNRILPRWAWFSGGIEFNFPIAHSPAALERVGYHVFQTAGRSSIQCGETERRHGLSWIVEISLGDQEDFVTQRAWLRNPGTRHQPWCLWNNAAIRSTPRTEYLFPTCASVLRHAHVVDEIRWPEFGTHEKDFDRMTGLFWPATGNAFGVWHPEENIGLLHLADPSVYRGMKMWTYGRGKHAHWPQLFTDDGRPYAEIQSGAVVTQAQEMLMEPGQELFFLNFWKPITQRAEITQLTLPQPQGELPPCIWIGNDHIPELRAWNQLKDNPDDPELLQSPPDSPPPPLPDYEVPLRAAHRGNPSAWRSHLATYLCAVQDITRNGDQGKPCYAEVLKILENPVTAAEWRIRGLVLWRRFQDPQSGSACLRQAQKLSGDIQLACDLDACLSGLGDTAARNRLLDTFPSSDGRWTERKIDLLLEMGQVREAKDLLLATRWDLYHLRHVRTNLYKRCQCALGLAETPIPPCLGEDDMAPWGAYRPQASEGYGKQILTPR